MSAEAERWREVDVKRALAAEVQEAGDALLAALEAAAADRDRWVKVATGTAAMLEARERELRWVEPIMAEVAAVLDEEGICHTEAAVLSAAARRVRDLLAGRATGGEG